MGYVVEVAGDNLDLSPTSMHLDASTVEFPLHRSHADFAHCLGHVSRCSRKHRRDRTQHNEANGGHRFGPLFGQNSGCAKVAGQQVRSSNTDRIHRERRSDRIEHDAAERSDPEITKHHVGDELPFRRARTPTKVAQDCRSPSNRSFPDMTGEVVEGGIKFQHHQSCSSAEFCVVFRFTAKRRPSNPNSPLPGKRCKKASDYREFRN